MSASTASVDSHAATAPDASVPATAAPMDLKIPITGVVVLLLQGSWLWGRGSTTFDLTASSDLFRLPERRKPLGGTDPSPASVPAAAPAAPAAKEA